MQRLRVDPPLDPGEIEFLDGFHADAPVRRVWPGQPGAHSPWRPTPDGDLELDEAMATADPDAVVPWLRFLIQQLLTPRTPAALERALDNGLRCGHRLSGQVIVGHLRLVDVRGSRVSEQPLDDDDLLVMEAPASPCE